MSDVVEDAYWRFRDRDDRIVLTFKISDGLKITAEIADGFTSNDAANTIFDAMENNFPGWFRNYKQRTGA